ncbi:MAG: SatD family protein [Pseudolysinimonas sp.]
MDASGVAVILDLIGSRRLADRALGQLQLTEAADRVNRLIAPVQPIAATVGDEFQALYADAASAFEATLLLRLWLPDGLDCRFGIGAGGYRTISRVPHDIHDGSAWWSAREAIDVAKAKQDRRNPAIRSWYSVDAEHVGGFPEQETARAYLISRDYIVGKMRPSTRAMLRGSLVGQTQTELANELRITQGTVSSAMRKSGPSIVIEGVDQIRSRWGK